MCVQVKDSEMVSAGEVFFVHAVDTEGPLYEGLSALFSTIKDQFGIELAPTRGNIERLRQKKIDVGEKADALQAFVNPDRVDKYVQSWGQMDEMHEVFMSAEWRNRFKDTAGKPYAVSWFCMDHVGFGNNPRRRAMGYHHVFDYYMQKLEEYLVKQDRIYWHYHPASFSNDAHRMGYNYSFSKNLHNEILARRVIDRSWFPSANRPGGHIETFDINCWLEAWIPFDLANQSMLNNVDLEAEELAGRVPGRHGDWRGAPSEWVVYNPDLYDFRKPGGLKRWIGRCLNIKSRHTNITAAELEAAFIKAQCGEKVLVSYTNHDFRNMVSETEELLTIIEAVAKKYDVKYNFCPAVDAFREVLSLPQTEPLKFNFDIDQRFAILNINVEKGSIWGTQPFLALRTMSGDYYHDNFINNPDGTWTYSFDQDSVTLEMLSHIGIAANDISGKTTVNVINLKTNEISETLHNV